MALAIIVSLVISWLIGHLFPHDRPFVNHIGYNFPHHAPDDSFPSDHGTVIFTFALAFIFWHRLWVWRPVYGDCRGDRLVTGVPRRTGRRDMLVGSAALIGCLSAQMIWQRFGTSLYSALQACYRTCFALPIRKGWVRT